MTTINQDSWNERENQLENNGADDGSLLHSNRITNDRPEGIYKGAYATEDEDDQNLSDDDVNGRDLDTDNADEWDEDSVSETDLDEDDLRDNDQVNADLHNVKNDQFGSLVSSMQNGPDPNEIPEEEEAGNNELDYPDDDKLEKGTDDEVEYKENYEVEQPRENEVPDEKPSTLGNLDSTFTDNSHGRTSGRLGDHEPGAGSTPRNGAYNL